MIFFLLISFERAVSRRTNPSTADIRTLRRRPYKRAHDFDKFVRMVLFHLSFPRASTLDCYNFFFICNRAISAYRTTTCTTTTMIMWRVQKFPTCEDISIFRISISNISRLLGPAYHSLIKNNKYTIIIVINKMKRNIPG